MALVLLSVLGLCMGSFIGALVWRLHNKKDWVKARSMCPHCKHELTASDLVPVLSWIELRGRCRYCQKPIGWLEPLLEITTAALFVLSYLQWPYQLHGWGWVQFGTWLVALVLLIALAVYDLRWMLLPNNLVYPLIGVAVAHTITLMLQGQPLDVLMTGFWGVLLTAGVFYALFQLSAGKWIGGGDVKLMIGLGMLVGGPLAAILTIFLASLAGCFVAVPLLAQGKAKRSTRIPFGPFLILAGIVVFLFGGQLTEWYEQIFLNV